MVYSNDIGDVGGCESAPRRRRSDHENACSFGSSRRECARRPRAKVGRANKNLARDRVCTYGPHRGKAAVRVSKNGRWPGANEVTSVGVQKPDLVVVAVSHDNAVGRSVIRKRVWGLERSAAGHRAVVSVGPPVSGVEYA